MIGIFDLRMRIPDDSFLRNEDSRLILGVLFVHPIEGESYHLRAVI
jgi:hypothetical protein